MAATNLKNSSSSLSPGEGRGEAIQHLAERKCKITGRIHRNIIINHHAVLIARKESGYPEWKGKYEKITDPKTLDDFAYADGFANWREMKLWWKVTHGMNCFPFVGQLIKW